MQVKLLDPELYADDIVRNTLQPKHLNDAGIDLRSAETLTVHAGEGAKIRLGIAVAVPSHYVGWITGRSTTALKMGLFVHEGKIDSGYRGEIHAFVTAQGSPVHIARGDRLCQLVLVAIRPPGLPGWEVAEELEPSTDTRGEQGLGSTGLR